MSARSIKSVTSSELVTLRPGILNLMQAAYGSISGEARFFGEWSCWIDAGEGEVFVATDEGQVKGIFCSRYFSGDFYGEKIAVEAHWFVLPEARNSHLAVQLFDAFESAAKARECLRIRVLSPKESINSFLQRKGFESAGTMFQKEL